MAKMHDVCLVLEGSYPYVSGGVSTWVHNLIKALPEISFTGLCILPSEKEKFEVRYELPSNFTDWKTVFIHDSEATVASAFTDVKKKDMADIRVMHRALETDFDFTLLRKVIHVFRDKEIPLADLMHGRRAWNFMCDLYERNAGGDSFLDYFWTFRFTHLPIFKILSQEIPQARVYHSISTGYAGLFAAVAKIVTGRPMLLTEHGIYVKERKIEISQAEWIQREGPRMRLERDLNTLQKFWIRIFQSLGKVSYAHSNRIFTLYGGNRELEIAEGADPAKIEIVPNGINMSNFKDLRSPERDRGTGKRTHLVAFVGRVVPIKDVKTFLRACKIASMKLEGFRAVIIGPTEEDETYYEECRQLTEILGLTETVVFTGKQDVRKVLPEIDLVVLTSISEAQPLVVLEANCAGVPVVCSDVGSCRELVEGMTEEDQGLGVSGLITRVADPSGTAKAMMRILGDDEQWHAMSEAGRKRVDKYYREEFLNDKYREIYTEHINMESEASLWQE